MPYKFNPFTGNLDLVTAEAVDETYYILQEDGYAILQENGDNLLTEDAVSTGTVTTSFVQVSTTYTVLSSDHTIECTSGTFTVTLPTAVGIIGQEFVIKNSGTGTITIDGAGSETIDGGLTAVMSTQYESITLKSNNTNWIII